MSWLFINARTAGSGDLVLKRQDISSYSLHTHAIPAVYGLRNCTH